MASSLFRFIPVTCASLGLRQREDNAELPSICPERDGVQVPALAEADLRRPKTHKGALDMFL